jgi:phospholipase C
MNSAEFCLRNGIRSIQHVFVLMFENHSFDHLFGFSGISGTHTATGLATTVNGPLRNRSPHLQWCNGDSLSTCRLRDGR